MEDPRPLSDRVSGLDDALLRVGRNLEARSLVAARFVVADCVRRHGEVLERLADGCGGGDLVCDGLVPYWPELAEVVDGLPRGGCELLPVAAGSLSQVPPAEARQATSAAAVLCPLVRAALEDDPDDLALLVLEELLETLVLQALI